jgi:hypothetical protein
MNGTNFLRFQAGNLYERMALTSSKRTTKQYLPIWRMKAYGRIMDYLAKIINFSCFIKL